MESNFKMLLPKITLNSNFKRAYELLLKLENAGHLAYFAGGCVRDILLEEDPKDYDIATSATPYDIETLFSNPYYTVDFVGRHFGVSIVDGIEIATFRSDGCYGDNRHPDNVQYEIFPEKDAARRDFTMNALYMAPDGTILDFVDGIESIRHRVLKCVGKPEDRFREDYLRILRAIRFASRFDLEIETEEMEWIRQLTASILFLPKERIQSEMVKIFSGENVQIALKYLFIYTSIASAIFEIPDPDNIKKYQKMMQIVDPSLSFLDEKITYHDVFVHLELSYDFSICSWMKKFKFSNEDIKKVKNGLWVYRELPDAKNLPLDEFKILLQNPEFDHTYGFFRNISFDYELHERYYLNKEKRNPEPLLTGDDLIALGQNPSPILGSILKKLRRKQLLEEITTKEEALEYCKTF